MFKALLMSIGMFSILPVTKNHWEDCSVPWVIPLMPIVGGLIGVLWYAAALLTQNIPAALQTAAVMLMPLLLTGCLHLDGLMDTADAVFSRRDLPEKRRILKDSHVGAFAVIALACLFVLQYAAVKTILAEKQPLLALLFIPVVSRCTVALLLLKMQPFSESGFAAMFRSGAARRHLTIPAVIFVLVFIPAFLLGGTPTVTVLLVESLFTATTMFYLAREFGGISGDLCGCSLTLGELSALITLSVI